MKKYPRPKIDEGDFHKVINNAIKQERNVEYIQNVLKEYGDYKDFFDSKGFDANLPRGYVYRFKVTYRHDRKVWCTIEMKGNQSLDDFADCIIYSMGWMNDHMHRFVLPDISQKNYQFVRSRYVIYHDAEGWEDDPFPTFKTDSIRVDDVNYDTFPKLFFEFDFGDSHEFDIELKLVRGPEVGEVKSEFPKILKESGTPPEQYPEYNEDYCAEDEGLSIADDKDFQEFVKLFRMAKSDKADFFQAQFLSEYFEMHKELPENIKETDIQQAIKVLKNDKTKPSSAKYAILVLAHVGTTEVLKTLEEFGNKVEGELKFWTDTAIGECMMFIGVEKE